MDGIQKDIEDIEKNRVSLNDGQKKLEHFGATLRQHQADVDRREVDSKKARKVASKR